MLSPEPGYFIWEAVTFALLIVVLRVYAWRPLLIALRSREESVALSLRKAAETCDESEKILQEIFSKRQTATRHAQQIVDENLKIIKELKTKSMVETDKEHQNILDDARREVLLLKEQALQSLRIEMGNLTIQAAGMILEDRLDETRQRKLIDSFIESLANGNMDSRVHVNDEEKHGNHHRHR